LTITAVIPTFNRSALLQQAVASIEADEIIVVDNGSTERIAPVGARVLRLDRNYGFAYAVNRGIEAAQGDAVAIVNNDVVLSPGYLRLLAQTGAWFATGKILQQAAPDRIDATFDLLARSGCALRAGHGAPATEFSEARFSGVNCSTGSAFSMRASAPTWKMLSLDYAPPAVAMKASISPRQGHYTGGVRHSGRGIRKQCA
jgi:glycosyltransferase involved in cell wall biosynthesis